MDETKKYLSCHHLDKFHCHIVSISINAGCTLFHHEANTSPRQIFTSHECQCRQLFVGEHQGFGCVFFTKATGSFESSNSKQQAKTTTKEAFNRICLKRKPQISVDFIWFKLNSSWHWVIFLNIVTESDQHVFSNAAWMTPQTKLVEQRIVANAAVRTSVELWHSGRKSERWQWRDKGFKGHSNWNNTGIDTWYMISNYSDFIGFGTTVCSLLLVIYLLGIRFL